MIEQSKQKGKKNPTGKCALCLRERELRRSHYMPASMYRRLRNQIDDEPATPIMVNADTRKSVATDRQYWAHLLCDECEGKFSKHGENLIMPLLRYKTGFVLRDQLCAWMPYNAIPRKALPEIDTQAFAYFVASILWRGSVHKWPEPSHRMNGKLGPYQEQLRQYLNFEVPFPKNVLVRVGVNIDEQNYGTVFPQPFDLFNSGKHTREYGFVCFDVCFSMSIGKTIDRELMTVADLQAAPVLVQKFSFDKSGLGQLYRKMVQKSPMVN